MRRTTITLRSRPLLLAGALVGAAGLAVLPGRSAGGSDQWDSTVAAKPAVLSDGRVDPGPSWVGWEDGEGPRPVLGNAHRIYDDGVRTVWLTPSTIGGVCMILDVQAVYHEQAAGCFLAEDMARAAPFVLSTTYSLTVGVITEDGMAEAVARERGGVAAGPNLVWLERIDSSTPLPMTDPFELNARYS